MSDFVYGTTETNFTSLDVSCNLDFHATPAMTISGITSPPLTASLPANLTHGDPFSSITIPSRNLTGATSSSLGDVSLEPDEARQQMNCDLQDRICLLTRSNDFWGKMLMTEAVSAAVITNISKEIKDHINALVNSSDEEEMYAPLVSPRLMPSPNLFIICRQAYWR